MSFIVFFFILANRTWSRQHEKIRTRRPLAEYYPVERIHPENEWWRERVLKVQTFMGFPDVGMQALRGGTIFSEKMDAITLSVILDRMATEKIENDDVWNQLCWRAQNLAHETNEPDLGYIYRAMAKGDWFDQHFVTTYLGRIQRRVPFFQLRDVAIVLEAFGNPNFCHDSTLAKLKEHSLALLTMRDDHNVEDLALFILALEKSQILEPQLSCIAAQTLTQKDVDCLSDGSKARLIAALAKQQQKIGNQELAANLSDNIWTLVMECDETKVRNAISLHDAVDLLNALSILPYASHKAKHLINAAMMCIKDKNFEASDNPSLLCYAALAAGRLHEYDALFFESLSVSLAEYIAAPGAVDNSAIVAAFTGFIRANKQVEFASTSVIQALKTVAGDITVHDAVVLAEGFSRLRGSAITLPWCTTEQKADIQLIEDLTFYQLSQNLSTLHPYELASLCGSKMGFLHPALRSEYISLEFGLEVLRRTFHVRKLISTRGQVDLLTGVVALLNSFSGTDHTAELTEAHQIFETTAGDLISQIASFTAADAADVFSICSHLNLDSDDKFRLALSSIELLECSAEHLISSADYLNSRALVRLLNAISNVVVFNKDLELSETVKRTLASHISQLLDARRFELYSTGDATLVHAADSMRRMGLVPHLLIDAAKNGERLVIYKEIESRISDDLVLEGMRKKHLWAESLDLESSLDIDDGERLIETESDFEKIQRT